MDAVLEALGFDGERFSPLAEQVRQAFATGAEVGMKELPTLSLRQQMRGRYNPANDTPLLRFGFDSKGFTVRDSVGVVPLSSVRIVFDTIVELTLSRDLVGAAYVRYADKTYHDGNGCLRDSDSFVATDRYVYQAGSGQYPEANIAALVDKPYPMHNWCVAFNLKIQ